jgi:hypothetical protein
MRREWVKCHSGREVHRALPSNGYSTDKRAVDVSGSLGECEVDLKNQLKCFIALTFEMILVTETSKMFCQTIA